MTRLKALTSDGFSLTTRPESPADPARLRTESLAISTSFAANGFLVASWAARIPQVRDAFDISPRSLGLLILCAGVGTLVSLPAAGLLVGSLGSARAVQLGAVGASAGIVLVGTGVLVSPWLVAIGLVAFGFCTAFWNVAQNVEAAAVERATGRPIMSRFHAVFSIGTVAGALAGAGANAAGISVTVHLCLTSAVVALACLVASCHFAQVDGDGPERPEPGSVRRAWREPRTIAIGLFALALAFAQGAGMDWIAVAATDGMSATPAVASFAYAAFVVGMAATRWVGPTILARLGRVKALRVGLLVALAGTLAFVLVRNVPSLVLSAFVWGCGIALGYPVAMSAAADNPRMAAPRVSVVASLTVLALLGGPTLIGLVAERTGTANSMFLVVVALLAAFGCVAATKPIPLDDNQPSPSGD
jgi:fucose permease